MNLKQMKYFVTIADEGSISRAAKVLHISQPPLSQQLHQLEDELRVRLFVRGARSMTLTDAGRLLYQHAQNILELSDRAIKDLQQFEDEGRGSLRIGMVSSSEVPYVLERIKPFREKYPRMEFQIYEGNTYQLLDWMKEGRVELAFVRTPFAEDGFECLSLEEETMAAVGKREFFGGGQPEEIAMGELARMPLIIYRRWETILNHSFREARVPVPDYFCVCDDMWTSLAWAKCGFGTAIVPASSCDGADAAGMVVARLTDARVQTRLTLIRRKDRRLSRGAETFLKCFVEGR